MKIRWKLMPSGKRKIRQGQEGWQEKKATQAKVTGERQWSTRDSRVSVETEESTDTKLLLVGTSSRPNFKAKARAQEVEIESYRNLCK